MPILTRAECAKYTEVIVVAVFADRVSAYAVQKNASGISLLISATENQEEGEMNEEKVRFNCHKVLQAMPQEHFFSQNPVVFLLDPTFSEYSFVSVDAKRERKEMPISDQELKAIGTKYYGSGKEADMIFRNFPGDYLVDGFAVPEPLGLNGQNITAIMTAVSVPKAIEAVFSEVASSHGLAYAGMMSMCQLIAEAPFFMDKEDSVRIAIFENETMLLLARNGHCAGIGKVLGGYGILEREAAQSLAVGAQEAKNILAAWQKGAADDAVARTIEGIVANTVPALRERLKSTLVSLDAEHLLPALFKIVQFGYLAQPAKRLGASTDWLKDAPVARNATMMYMESATAHVSDPKGVLKNHQESGADLLLLSALLE